MTVQNFHKDTMEGKNPLTGGIFPGGLVYSGTYTISGLDHHMKRNKCQAVKRKQGQDSILLYDII